MDARKMSGIAARRWRTCSPMPPTSARPAPGRRLSVTTTFPTPTYRRERLAPLGVCGTVRGCTCVTGDGCVWPDHEKLRRLAAWSRGARGDLNQRPAWNDTPLDPEQEAERLIKAEVRGTAAVCIRYWLDPAILVSVVSITLCRAQAAVDQIYEQAAAHRTSRAHRRSKPTTRARPQPDTCARPGTSASASSGTSGTASKGDEAAATSGSGAADAATAAAAATPAANDGIAEKSHRSQTAAAVLSPSPSLPKMVAAKSAVAVAAVSGTGKRQPLTDLEAPTTADSKPEPEPAAKKPPDAALAQQTGAGGEATGKTEATVESQASASASASASVVVAPAERSKPQARPAAQSAVQQRNQPSAAVAHFPKPRTKEVHEAGLAAMEEVKALRARVRQLEDDNRSLEHQVKHLRQQQGRQRRRAWVGIDAHEIGTQTTGDELPAGPDGRGGTGDDCLSKSAPVTPPSAAAARPFLRRGGGGHHPATLRVLPASMRSGGNMAWEMVETQGSLSQYRS
eukprot:COSAG01_NODE_7725_length_3082_cov_204.291988_3_plen_512_part_00